MNFFVELLNLDHVDLIMEIDFKVVKVTSHLALHEDNNGSDKFVITIKEKTFMIEQDDIDLIVEHSSLFHDLEKRLFALENPNYNPDEE